MSPRWHGPLGSLRSTGRRWSAYLRFVREYRRFRASGGPRFPVRWADRHPCLDDWTATTAFDRHYVYHTAWAARVVKGLRPAFHVDLSSSLYFAALVSAFVPVRFYDLRPADLRLDGLESGEANLLALPFADRSVASLSCMHVVEHVGLGRYGDPLDSDGDLKAMAELRRVLAPGGSLLFVTPVGRPKVAFNAHRIYAFRQVREQFAELELAEFALVPDDPAEGGLLAGASEAHADRQTYGCGCFWFKRRPA